MSMNSAELRRDSRPFLADSAPMSQATLVPPLHGSKPGADFGFLPFVPPRDAAAAIPLSSRWPRRLPPLFASAALLLTLAEADALAAEAPTRSVWVAPTYQVLLGDALEPSSRHGLGASAAYEFHISPTFDLGLAIAYRLYPGEVATQQVGYGAVLKHFFSAAWSRDDGVYPYIDYGLLLQQTFIEGRTGSAVSHDTRLGVGSVLRGGGVPLFVGLAGHYSRLQQLDVASRWLGYVDVQIGWVHTF
jgi:hypothetical protein